MRHWTTALLVSLLVAAPALGAAGAENEAAAPVEGTGEETSELTFKWLNFAIVFGGLAYLLRRPVRQFFEGQRSAIRGAMEEARQAQERSQARLNEIDQRLARLDQEVEAMRTDSRESAAAEQERIRRAARREAERILATTRAEIDSASRAARQELRAYTARLAVTLAEQNIQQQLNPKLQATLFQASLAEFDRDKRRG